MSFLSGVCLSVLSALTPLFSWPRLFGAVLLKAVAGGPGSDTLPSRLSTGPLSLWQRTRGWPVMVVRRGVRRSGG